MRSENTQFVTDFYLCLVEKDITFCIATDTGNKIMLKRPVTDLQFLKGNICQISLNVILEKFTVCSMGPVKLYNVNKM
ncbi:hypothetical protein NQ315_007897 [Exocentrus adspersus]|uniref:Uncharacterized protein n=1 Tax=Exocentrus adspersus TaxID=1586481 RepID=A0AAV8W883_9CUCU|nr:hypothetical protein NQ315_007897 [Exocentrus adspersus]